MPKRQFADALAKGEAMSKCTCGREFENATQWLKHASANPDATDGTQFHLKVGHAPTSERTHGIKFVAKQLEMEVMPLDYGLLSEEGADEAARDFNGTIELAYNKGDSRESTEKQCAPWVIRHAKFGTRQPEAQRALSFILDEVYGYPVTIAAFNRLPRNCADRQTG